MRKRGSKTASRRGATTVEFAICLPILFSVLFGLLEFARVTQLQQAARLAAFEGARAGVSLNASTTDVKSAVNKVMSAVSISSFTTTITPETLAYTSPTVSVTVALSPNANAWFKWYVSDNSVITANVTLSREVQAVSVP